jgi:tetratricopeptide (TPR) repeat protein
MIKSKKNLILFFFILFSIPLFAQRGAQPWWLSLEQGKIKYRNGDYGTALLLFEDARRDRRAMYEQMERDYISLLSINEVRRLGDSLENVEKYSYDRYYTAASAALEELYYRIPKASFNNSAHAALDAFGKLKDYPEAEYWIGEVYRAEGELSLALAQYRKANEMRDILEDSGFSTSLQYKIASILRTKQEYNEMEKVLLYIINELDTLWSNARTFESSEPASGKVPVPYAQASASFASQSMTRILENEGIARFMELYRYNNEKVEQAHRLLGFHYAVTGRPSAQQHLMFAFLIQNTIIINEIKRKEFDFTFTNLQAFTEFINKSALLLSFIEEVEYYKTAYYLGASLYRNGKTTTAREFWNFLSSQPQAGEWSSRASMQLRNPHLEPIVEMP